MMHAHWREVFEEDLRANGRERWHPFMRVYDRKIYFIRCLRRLEHLRHDPRSRRTLRYLVRRAHFALLSERLSFDIPPGVFSPGLSIAHSGTIVVNGDASVGMRCRIHPGVTIGAVGGNAPTIGDDVFVGPNALILGGIRVGNGAVIGPGALINFDIGDGETFVAARASNLRKPR